LASPHPNAKLATFPALPAKDSVSDANNPSVTDPSPYPYPYSQSPAFVQAVLGNACDSHAEEETNQSFSHDHVTTDHLQRKKGT